MFCPECGRRLVDPPTLFDRLARALDTVLHGRRNMPAVPAAFFEVSTSAVVRGYGAALYRLGWRYERGSSRNVNEAVRCYRKSARLGNSAAANRLESPSLAKPFVPTALGCDPFEKPKTYADDSKMKDDGSDK
jgi:TPR repeat protein